MVDIIMIGVFQNLSEKFLQSTRKLRIDIIEIKYLKNQKLHCR